MSDRELLEKAAKAAGDINLPLLWVREFDGDLTPVNNRGEAWNPLTDDGDALRLAVKLRIGMVFHHDHVIVGNGGKAHADEHIEDYKYAIVRAAAAIGEHQ